jgi:hypothetical protein
VALYADVVAADAAAPSPSVATAATVIAAAYLTRSLAVCLRYLDMYSPCYLE